MCSVVGGLDINTTPFPSLPHTACSHPASVMCLLMTHPYFKYDTVCDVLFATYSHVGRYLSKSYVDTLRVFLSGKCHIGGNSDIDWGNSVFSLAVRWFWHDKLSA